MVINDQKIFFYNKYKLYGISYMYSGLFPRILGIVPMRFIFWGEQGTSNEYLKQYNMIDKNR